MDNKNYKAEEIDVSKIDLEQQKDKTTETPHILPYAHTAGGAVIKPEDQGKIKGRAVQAMHEQTENQMSQLYEQMQTLAKQAQNLQHRVSISERIYNADIRFEPLIGRTYHLYQYDTGDRLSLIAPDEWGKKSPTFLATVYLLADHTWEIKELGNIKLK